MRGVIYARYSPGPHQTDQSIEGQVADCTSFAAENDISIVEIYADRHISGKSIDGRDEFQRMIRDARKKLFDCVIVWKVDRFGRNRQDIALYKLELKRAGVKLMYAKESIPDGPEGIILESVIEGMAEYYSADLRQKVQRGIRETMKKGEYTFCLPLGYTRDADRHIIIDQEKADVVREAFRLHAAGSSEKDLLKLFSDRGIVGQRGKPISYGTLYRMLRNERYLGHFEVSGISIEAEPIIDRETFEAASKHFGTSRNNAAGTAKVDYMLSCKCFCGYCGKILRGESGTGKKGKVYNYYKCSTQKRGKACELKPVSKEKLEQAVIRATMKDMLTDDMIEKLTKRIMEIQEEDFARDPAAAFRRQLDSNQKKQRNILDAIEDGAPAKGLTTRLMELEKAEEDLLQKIDHAAIKKPRLTIELVRAWLCSFRAGDVSDPDFQRRLLDTFVARVELKNGEAVVFYNARPDHGRGKCSTTITKVDYPESWSNPSGPIVVGPYIILRVAV